MSGKRIAFSILGTVKDFVGRKKDRWQRWRPNVALCYQDDLPIDELHLIHESRSSRLADKVILDINEISPQTKVVHHVTEFENPWDLEEVYAKLFDICDQHPFQPEKNEYLFHITTGTHIAQIVCFLLAESRIFPGKLIQTSPAKGDNKALGTYQVIDLNLSKYDKVAARFKQKQLQGTEFLKGGIATRNKAFNHMIDQIERVAIRSKASILLTGPTGAGKSQLAQRIFDLKHLRKQVEGSFVAVNCATLRGDNAMSALFGHVKGAFTGAQNKREGFLVSADCGVLFLDEIGELGLDEQAMLLHALENKSFYPVGADKEVCSDFQLIAGTNRDLQQQVSEGKFREDLLARINLWTYQLPGLADRREDIEPNIEFELRLFEAKENLRVEFNAEAKKAFLKFAMSPQSSWQGNFRDLNAAILRMSTLAEGGRIGVEDVSQEVSRLTQSWRNPEEKLNRVKLENYLNAEQLENLDRFEVEQLSYVIGVCQKHSSMAAAGRYLFNKSRESKSMVNDSSRLQKYLARYGLKWSDLNRFTWRST